MTHRIGACVVFFNPSDAAVNNVRTYLRYVDTLIIVDNSPISNEHLVTELVDPSGKLIYLWQGENVGIATALNRGCEAALQQSCTWVLTMDQDSSFREGDIEVLKQNMEEVQNIFDNVAMICADHKVHEEAKLKSYAISGGQTTSGKGPFTEITSTMTSGNLLRLDAWQAAGPFLEKFFIDHVDHEYCLRLRKKGFRLVQVNTVLLNHALGTFQLKSFLGKQLKISNHNPIRRYYMTRNGLYVVSKYFSLDRRFCGDILKNIFFFDLIKISFFEQQKAAKIGAVVKGIYHFLINRYGKYK